MKNKRIFLDNAASTPVKKEVLKAMKPFWNKDFGNAGAIHKEGVTAKKSLRKFRKKVADILKAQAEEIIFTGSGTESNSLAIFGFLDKLVEGGTDVKDIHIITSVMEHPSILQWFKKYEKKGVSVSYIGIDKDGILDLTKLRKELKPNTVLVSIMYVNNEIGTVQPISKISHIIRDYQAKNQNKEIIFHTDASQAPLYLPINVNSLGVDLLTIDGQKIYGPKGVGALYKSKKIDLNPVIFGGSQESGLRAGTENIPLIAGLAKALELADEQREKESKRLIKLRDDFIENLKKEIKGVILNGTQVERLPNNVNISIPNTESEFMIIKLDKEGIASSSKSACIKDDNLTSYVIDSLRKEGPKNSLRFTLGKDTKKKDLDYVVKTIKKFV